MGKRKMEEYENEVFIWDDGGESKSLVVVEKDTGNMFSLEVKNYCGKITKERKKEMESIGIFSVYD